LVHYIAAVKKRLLPFPGGALEAGRGLTAEAERRGAVFKSADVGGGAGEIVVETGKRHAGEDGGLADGELLAPGAGLKGDLVAACFEADFVGCRGLKLDKGAAILGLAGIVDERVAFAPGV